MDKVEEIFSQEELDYLSKKRPDLVPMDLPSLSDAPTLRRPSLDQMIVKFLKKYEVNVEPRSVGSWNGWDTVSTISSILSSERGSMRNIASTMFYANRSNQINSAAQDWGTWKRWVFDSKEKEFEQFKNELIKTINTFNKNVIAETEEKIRKATVNNQKIFKVLKEPDAKKFVAELSEINKSKELELKKRKILKRFIVIGSLIFSFILYSAAMDGFDKRNAKELFNKGYWEFRRGNFDTACELIRSAWFRDREGVESYLIDERRMLKHFKNYDDRFPNIPCP